MNICKNVKARLAAPAGTNAKMKISKKYIDVEAHTDATIMGIPLAMKRNPPGLRSNVGTNTAATIRNINTNIPDMDAIREETVGLTK